MSRVRFHPFAREDMREAAAFFNTRRTRLGYEFLAVIRAALQLIKERPLIGAPLKGDVRRFVVDRFPYSIIYEPRAKELFVYGVMHHRGDPTAWRKRL